MATTIHRLSEQCGLSVAELAARSGLDGERTLAILESRWTPSPAERLKLATALGVEVDEIAWGHGTPVQHLWGN
jgi:transcriptional regulator with XRE-family HTH domain